MSKKKQKSRKKQCPRRLQILVNARACAQTTWESRRPLESTISQPPNDRGKSTLLTCMVAGLLACACAHGGVAASIRPYLVDDAGGGSKGSDGSDGSRGGVGDGDDDSSSSGDGGGEQARATP